MYAEATFLQMDRLQDQHVNLIEISDAKGRLGRRTAEFEHALGTACALPATPHCY
jgi:hypothetical protein